MTRKVHIHAHTHTCIHIHTYTYTYTYTHTQGLKELQQVLEHPILKKVLGAKAVHRLHTLLTKHDVGAFVETLLLEYYDPAYSHGGKHQTHQPHHITHP